MRRTIKRYRFPIPFPFSGRSSFSKYAVFIILLCGVIPGYSLMDKQPFTLVTIPVIKINELLILSFGAINHFHLKLNCQNESVKALAFSTIYHHHTSSIGHQAPLCQSQQDDSYAPTLP